MPSEPWTASEREEIRAGIERREPDRVIANRLGRHRCTINGEINRNGGRSAYSATEAQERADAALARPKTPVLVANPALAGHVTDRLGARDSAMTIARELAGGLWDGVEGTVSHEATYQAIYAHGARGLPKGTHRGLVRSRPCRKHRPAEPTEAKSPLGDFAPIRTRPPAAQDRSQVGHLEGDLIVGAYNRSAIVTLFDRASRYCWLADLPEGHGADETLAGLLEALDRIPEPLRRTLTWDQGREMACHADLAELSPIAMYFADPHSPWQRPTNENGNAFLRRWLPKSTDLGRCTPADLRCIEHRINTTPRRSLDWATAATVYTGAVAMTG